MTPLESLELPAPIIHALLKAGLRHVEDLCALTVREVMAIDGISPKIQGVTDNLTTKHRWPGSSFSRP